MSNITQIPDHYTIAYETAWQHLLQQQDSRLKDKCKFVQKEGAAVRFNQLGLSTMNLIASRAATTPQSDLALPTRWAYPQPYDIAAVYDEWDSLFLGSVVLPTSETMQSQVHAYNRTVDGLIYQALGASSTITTVGAGNPGTAFGGSGSTSTTSVSLPSGSFSGTASISGTTMTVTGSPTGTIGVGSVISGSGIAVGTTVVAVGSGGTYTVTPSQTVSSTTVNSLGQTIRADYVPFGGTATLSSLTIAKIRLAKQILDHNEAPKENRVLLISSKELNDLLATTEVTNFLYNSVKALVAGEVDTFLGFRVERSEIVTTADSTTWNGVSYSDVCRGVYAYQKDMVALVDGGRKTYMDILPTQSHALQIRSTAVLGATRLLEGGVVQILCDTTK